MANVFSMSNERVRDVNRNVFDLSFKYSGTFKFGALYPVICKEVLSGDSWNIDPTFGFEFMPMVFPVQTRMRAHLHFFYVRRRNLWRDYKDYFGALKENLDPPYLDFSTNFDNLAKTGSLGDYFGLPTTIVGDYGNAVEMDGLVFGGTGIQDIEHSVEPSSTYYPNATALLNALRSDGTTGELFDSLVLADDFTSLVGNGYNLVCFSQASVNGAQSVSVPYKNLVNGLRFRYSFEGVGELSDAKPFSDLSFAREFIYVVRLYVTNPSTQKIELRDQQVISFDDIQKSVFDGTYSFTDQTFVVEFKYGSSYIESNIPEGSDVGIEMYAIVSNPNPDRGIITPSWSNPRKIALGHGVPGSSFSMDIDCSMQVFYADAPVRDITPETSPYYDSTSLNKDKQLKISAEPFRAYESVYNCFYRDSRNNPLMIDGQPEYNKWIPTDAGGPDTTIYKLRYRNWEQDFLTTAVQSPQQGVAPLVGITTRGDVRFMDQESGNVYTAKANVGEDGQTIESYTIMTPTMPEGNLLALGDMVSSGISINDFRNANALQIWLETNTRKGMTFKDLIKGHFNVDVRFDELDMPEFIGGVSRDVVSYSVTQTSSDVEGSPLGSYAGQASCVGASGDSVTHFCDEPGYIIGILSVVPVPAYSQLLPKHFIKRNVLDHFSPEFGHIGFVPIKYDEVCPIQAFNDDPDSLNDTFGYQRAWYDYLASTDEVHGLFRNQLRNYLMTRQFDIKPTLSESFLLVDPKQLNEVFASTTENGDKILGQINFDISVKRPIPRFGVPRLE